MSPIDALMWCLAALFALVVASGAFLIGWFMYDVIRGKR